MLVSQIMSGLGCCVADCANNQTKLQKWKFELYNMYMNATWDVILQCPFGLYPFPAKLK